MSTGAINGQRRIVSVAGAAMVMLLLAGCAPEEKVLRYKPFLTGVSGAQFAGEQGRHVNPNQGYEDPTRPADGQKSVVELADGSKVLISKNVRQMMTHLETCLDSGEDDLLLEQVISEKTKEEYRGRGKDPREVVRMLKRHRKDIAKLFSRMPMGEYTPTVILDQPGDKMWVVRLTGAPAEGLKFTKLWARLEEGNWRFVWVE